MEDEMAVELDLEQATRELGREIATIFIGHAEPLTEEEARELEPLVAVHLEAAYTVRTSMTPSVDVAMAEQIVTACKGMLAAYPSLDESRRAAVVGAVRYFIQTRDAESDLESGEGFKDDAMVVNYVIDLTGIDVPRITFK